MNKKFTVILLISISILTTAKAQEKQNDATWEETIGFIQENLQYALADPSSYERKVNYTIIDNKELEYKTLEIESTKDCMWKYTYNIPLYKIEKALYMDYTESSYYKEQNIYCALRIKTSGEYIKFSTCQRTGFIQEIDLLFSSVQLTRSMVKAFNHLAFLGKEKRKESKF